MKKTITLTFAAAAVVAALTSEAYVAKEERRMTGYEQITFDPQTVRGRLLVATAEVKGRLPENGPTITRFIAGFCKTDKNWYCPGLSLPRDADDWRQVGFAAAVPTNMTHGGLSYGIEPAKADHPFYFRNVVIETEDTTLDLRPFMNMGFADPVAGDGKGGWSDQGPQNDAAGFPVRESLFKGFPFVIVDPKSNGGKSTVLFKGRHFPAGVECASVDLSAFPAKGRYLNLLHALTWTQSHGKPVGFVEVRRASGKNVTIPVIVGQDVGESSCAVAVKNAFVATTWQNAEHGYGGAYACALDLGDDAGLITNVTFRSAGAFDNWHLIAATISSKVRKYPDPNAEVFEIREGEEWRQGAGWRPGADIVPGSALDLTKTFPRRSIGELGRVVSRPDGTVAFEKDPERPVRFMAVSGVPFTGNGVGSRTATMNTHEDIEAYCREIAIRGYNMVRLHSLSELLMSYVENMKRDYEFSPKFLEMLDYFIVCCHKYGIYINTDFGGGRFIYTAGDPWNRRCRPGFNARIETYFGDEGRTNFANGVAKFLDHTNPYTGVKMKDDPIFALCVCANEQESSIFGNFDFKPYEARWRTTIDTEFGGNFTKFLVWRERDLADFYMDVLDKAGFRGLKSSTNMGIDFRYTMLRTKYDAVTLNHYFAHPHGDHERDIRCSQLHLGPIDCEAREMRVMAPQRLLDKPFFNTEHSVSFWNSYRYEQAFTVGAYAALQDLQGLTAFTVPVCRRPNLKTPITTFAIVKDPVTITQEFLTMMAFRRGDVATAKPQVRFLVDDANISCGRSDGEQGMNSEQTKLSLVTRVASDTSLKSRPLGANEMSLRAIGGSRVTLGLTGLFQEAVEADPATYDADKVVDELRAKGLIAKSNRTSVKNGVYESATGELLMDSRKGWMTVDTARLQGLAAKAGVTADLRDFTVRDLTRDGCVAVVTVDDAKDLRTSKRMVLVYATNVLNSGMRFADKGHAVRLKVGHNPSLFRTGSCRFSLRNENAKKLRLYALGFDGTRLEELPLEAKDGTLSGAIDTHTLKNGVSFFYELVCE